MASDVRGDTMAAPCLWVRANLPRTEGCSHAEGCLDVWLVRQDGVTDGDCPLLGASRGYFPLDVPFTPSRPAPRPEPRSTGVVNGSGLLLPAEALLVLDVNEAHRLQLGDVIEHDLRAAGDAVDWTIKVAQVRERRCPGGSWECEGTILVCGTTGGAIVCRPPDGLGGNATAPVAAPHPALAGPWYAGARVALAVDGLGAAVPELVTVTFPEPETAPTEDEGFEITRFLPPTVAVTPVTTALGVGQIEALHWSPFWDAELWLAISVDDGAGAGWRHFVVRVDFDEVTEVTDRVGAEIRHFFIRDARPGRLSVEPDTFYGAYP